jgi:hypothetical protein
MIATHRAHAYRRSVLAAGVMLALALTTFTSAARATDGTPAAGREKAPASATEPAQAALGAWLALVDGGQYGASWDQAAANFRAALKRADWEKGVGSVRGPLGAVVSRTLRSATRKTSLPGAPDGDYVVIENETAFANGPTIETATMTKEADGQWRAVGYFVRPSGDTSAAEKALRDWLALVDAASYGPSWDAASAVFRAAVTRPDWERAVRAARGPLGAVVSRRTRAAMPQENPPGAPAGRYVIVQTDVSFANKASATETCTLQQEPDGAWRMAGYFVR